MWRSSSTVSASTLTTRTSANFWSGHCKYDSHCFPPPTLIVYLTYFLHLLHVSMGSGLWPVGWTGEGAVGAGLSFRWGDAECGVHQADGEAGITTCVPLLHKTQITKVKVSHQVSTLAYAHPLLVSKLVFLKWFSSHTHPPSQDPSALD